MLANGLANDWFTILMLVFTLGLRHGLDADHIVAIDGLTRFNSIHNPRLARWCGFLFSLGHGLAVVLIAFAVAALGRAWSVPRWLEDFGAWTSILLLAALGLVNLSAVFQTRPDVPVELVSVKGRFLGRLQRIKNPAAVTLVGAAFAVSFDTVSQAVLFAVIGVQYGGWEHCLMLGALFAAGMILVDACNGLWVFRLIARANRTALIASRLFGTVVALLSLLVAGFGISKYLSPQVNAWSGGRDVAVGLCLMGVVALGFIAAIAFSKMAAGQK
jgi:high-affinity nickel-transport protein